MAARKTVAKAKPSQRTARVARAAARKSAPTRRAVKRERTARNFDAGKTGRRLKAIPTTITAINSLIRQYGKNIVARSRYLASNNPYAASAKEAFVSAMVGTGIKPSSLVPDRDLKAAVQEAFSVWTDEADADGLCDYYGLQGLIAGEMFEAGECFVRFRERRPSDGLSVPLQLQLLPSEMVDVNHNEIYKGNRIECGIEFNIIGQRVAYWFYRQHPGEVGSPRVFFTGPSDRVRVPASEVLHLFEPIRAGQMRGIPHTVAGIITLAMIDLYDDAELERKRLAALFGAFITKEGVTNDDYDPFEGAVTNEETKDTAMEPGATIELEPGQDVKFAEPADVGSTYEAFQYRNLLRAAAGFGVTYSDMTGDLRQTSYGSIRAGLVSFRRRIEKKQHHVMVFQFCRPVWTRWFNLAVLNGAIINTNGIFEVTPAEYVAAPRLFNRVKHIPPKWEWVDPLKDRQAEKLAVDSGFKPRSDVIEAEGFDAEEVDFRIAADQERAANMGLKFITTNMTVALTAEDLETEEESAGPALLADDEEVDNTAD